MIKWTGNRASIMRSAMYTHVEKYFRTQAALGGMHPDLVTGIMRQTGYLDSTYVRMTEEERQKQFHEHETALYITRADHRIQTGKLSELERRNAELTARLAQVEQAQQEKSAIREPVRNCHPHRCKNWPKKLCQ